MMKSRPAFAIAFLTALVIQLDEHITRADNIEEFKSHLKKRAFQSKKGTDTLVNPCKPRHVHIAFGDEIVDMRIEWSTATKCEKCEVLYGIHPWSLDQSSRSQYEHFVKHNKKGMQHLYLSVLQNLHPNTTYFYVPVCGSERSGPFYFHVPSLTKNVAAEYIVFGDMGIKTKSVQTVIKEAQSGGYTAIIHAGDISYNFYSKGGMHGDQFMEMIEPAASFVPYMTCPGNHEMESDHLFTHYRHRFAMPDCEWPMPLNKLWYSMDIGLVHFISYSSEVFFTNEGKYVSTQKKWLLEDLTQANNRRNVTPWVIAFGHRPLYCSTRIGDDCSQNDSLVRKGLEKIFYDQRVDILLQAHEHNYERLWPMFKGTITDYSYENVSAPIQIITGAAGSHYGTDHFVKGDQPKWSAYRMGEPALNSYGRMIVENRTHIWWEQRSVFNHTLIDGIWIVKDDLFQWNTNITFVSYSRSEIGILIPAGIFVFCFFVIIVLFVVKVVIRSRQKQNFLKTWHAVSDKSEDEDEDEENEEFCVKDYKTSLI